ncbi:hypothetical protein ACIRVF_20700 [Kitasatospora sp. NPDC101157]|uniref:hypothetical protein n=1 Tax=Kitasatospora sp. NPDC101157 TaxID=3364098 RepID=UPI00380E2A76
MGTKKWTAAVVHCLPGAVPGTAAVHVSGQVRLSGRWVRIRPADDGDETWISAAAVQRIVWTAGAPD